MLLRTQCFINMLTKYKLSLYKNIIRYVYELKYEELSRYKNPCLDIQHYLEIPIFKANDIVFSPTLKDMQDAENNFQPSIGHEIKFLASCIDPEKFPQHSLPEVAFLGRSNVGKSSVIKSLLSKVPNIYVRTSKKPGHTKSVHFYQIGKSFCLVDMPGYGFNQPKCFVGTVESYLKQRQNLVKTFLLIDGKNGFQSIDEIALEMLEEFKISYCLTFTKIDKASDSRRLKNYLFLQQVKEKYASVCCFPQPFMLSAHSTEGMAYFQAFLSHITGNLKLENS